MTTRTAWTPELIDQLRQHAISGRSMTETGRLMGMTKNAIIGASHRFGVSFAGSHTKQTRGLAAYYAERTAQKQALAVRRWRAQ